MNLRRTGDERKEKAPRRTLTGEEKPTERQLM
jgi:hypothetical protein